MNQEDVRLAIGRAEALVLSEMLTDFHEQPCLPIDSPAEKLAFVRLQGALEKVLVEPFVPEYTALIDEARASLTAQSG